MWSFSLVIVIFACIHAIFSIVAHICNPHSNKIDNDILENSIFVCIVSYKDENWIPDVINMLTSSKCFQRVFIGVIEYIEKESISEDIPNKFRNNIRVKTVSSKTAKLLSHGRKECFENLYRNEKYVLFTKSAQLCDSWDEILINYVRENDEMVISTKLDNSTDSKFLKIKSVETNNVVLCTGDLHSSHYMQYIPSILWCEDFSFGKSECAYICFSGEHFLEIAANYHEEDVKVYHPGACIGKRVPHPTGLRSKTTISLAKKEKVVAFLKKIGIDMKRKHVAPQLLCGLTLNPNSEECISKYGSIWQAKLMIENLK